MKVMRGGEDAKEGRGNAKRKAGRWRQQPREMRLSRAFH